MSNLPSTTKPWDQRPDETDTAYDRFACYLKMGQKRTLERVRKEYGKNTAYLRQLERWSSKYDWVERASLFDSHLIRKSLEGKEEIIDEVTGKLLRAASLMADELIKIAMHEGTELAGEGMINVYSQKLKAIESILDRVGVTKKKESPDVGVVNNAQTLYQQINQTIIEKSKNAEG